MNCMSATAFAHKLIERVRAGKPFSMVRFGDGEAVIARYSRYATLEQARAQVQRWWLEPVADDTTICKLRSVILPALQDADMLGIPSAVEQKTWPKWNQGLRFDPLMRWLGLPKEGADLFYFYDIIGLDQRGVLEDALRNTRSIRLITCRAKALDVVRSRFNPRNLEMRLVRAEAFRWRPYAEIDQSARETDTCPPHWPDGYADVSQWIAAGGPGHVYLIGAGGLGKSYCAQAKAAGSIGLDLGALFDAWVGLITRPYLRPKT